MARILSLAAASLAASYAMAQNAAIVPCGGYVTWQAFSITPPAPQAGDTVYVRGNGTTSTVTVTNGTGFIDAYLYGIDVFEQPVNTCGQTQIDVLGIATGTLDALSCPVMPMGPANFTFYMTIPQEAQGLGALNITVTGSDQQQKSAFCLDLTLTL